MAKTRRVCVSRSPPQFLTITRHFKTPARPLQAPHPPSLHPLLLLLLLLLLLPLLLLLLLLLRLLLLLLRPAAQQPPQLVRLTQLVGQCAAPPHITAACLDAVCSVQVSGAYHRTRIKHSSHGQVGNARHRCAPHNPACHTHKDTHSLHHLLDSATAPTHPHATHQ